MIKYSKKHQHDGDIIVAQNPNYLKALKEQGYKFFGLVNTALPKNEAIMIKSNRAGQIEEVSPKEIGKVNLFSKYYHRPQAIYADRYISEVSKLMTKEA